MSILAAVNQRYEIGEVVFPILWFHYINHGQYSYLCFLVVVCYPAGEGSLGWKTDKDPCIISRRNIDRLSPLIALGLILSQHTHCHFSIEGAGSGMEAAEHILYGSAGCQ